jgi:hypothetical protein
MGNPRGRLSAAVFSTLVIAGCAGSGTTSTPGQLPTASQSERSGFGAHHYVPQRSLSPLAGGNPTLLLRHASPLPRAAHRPGTAPTYILTCNPTDNDCEQYSGAGDFIADLPDLSFPQGTSVGQHTGSWYIADTTAQDIAVYEVTGSGPYYISTFPDSGYLPDDVAVRELKESKFWVARILYSNIYTSSYDPGNAVYLNEHLQTSTMTPPNGHSGEGVGVAFDKKATDCYWSYQDFDGSGGYVAYYPGCANPGVIAVKGLEYAGGIAVDAKNVLWVVDQFGGIKSCKGKNWKCTEVFPASDFVQPLYINFSADFTTLYVADAGASTIDACVIATQQCSVAVDDVYSDDPNEGVAVLPGASP